MTPSAEQQLNFLQHLQRLFDEGEFVATYKYALLMALAELSVESEHVEGHIEAKNPWLKYHEFLTESMANVVGAKPIEVVVMNTLTANLHFMMVSFYKPTTSRS